MRPRRLLAARPHIARLKIKSSVFWRSCEPPARQACLLLALHFWKVIRYAPPQPRSRDPLT